MARKPKIAAPEGHRGCPRCSKVLPLVNPQTNEKNFASNGYCRPCSNAATRDSKVKYKLVAPEGAEPAAPSAVGIIRQGTLDQQFARAFIPPFPTLQLPPPPPRCACCTMPPTTLLEGQQFCDRCAYYVSASGRCPEHSFREFVPALLGRFDAPLLPKREVPTNFVFRQDLPEQDELDVVEHA